jgi:hypothetical protein
MNRVISELSAPSHSENQLTPEGVNYIIGDRVDVKVITKGEQLEVEIDDPARQFHP